MEKYNWPQQQDRSVTIQSISGQIVVTYRYPPTQELNRVLVHVCGIETSYVHRDYGQMYAERVVEALTDPTEEQIELARRLAAFTMAKGGYVTDMEIVRNVVRNVNHSLSNEVTK